MAWQIGVVLNKIFSVQSASKKVFTDFNTVLVKQILKMSKRHAMVGLSSAL